VYHREPPEKKMFMKGGAILKQSGGFVKYNGAALIHHQGIISPPRRDLASGVAFDRSSLRRIASYASVVAPLRPRSERDLRLASNTLMVIRDAA
jgi:hypothetical protein